MKILKRVCLILVSTTITLGLLRAVAHGISFMIYLTEHYENVKILMKTFMSMLGGLTLAILIFGCYQILEKVIELLKRRENKELGFEITTQWLIEKGACSDSIKAFKNQKETNSFKILDTLMKSEELDWAHWLITRLMTKKQCIQYAVFAARKALPVFEEKYPADDRPRKAIEAAERYLEDPSEENLQLAEEAGDAAWTAVYTARAASAYACAARTAACAIDAADAASAAHDARTATNDETFKEIINFGIKLLKEETSK